MIRKPLVAIAAIAAVIAVVLSHGTAPAQQEPFKTWSKAIPKGQQRFKVLSGLGGQAVLDKETGLVWEREPDPTEVAWAFAFATCTRRSTGGRMGWRLPTMAELTSLLDASSVPRVLPAGHPFDVEDATYWSATTYVTPSDTLFLGGAAWVMHSPLSSALPDTLNKLSTTLEHVWCVRGGGGQDAASRGAVDD